MHVLMISTDRKVFDEHSAVRARLRKYAERVDALSVVVFAPKGFSEIHDERLHLYSTNSSSRWRYIADAIQTAKRVGGPIEVVTAQDASEAGFVAWRAARHLGARLELQVHTDIFSPYFVKGSVLNRARRLLARFLLPKADCVRVVSKRVARSLSVSSHVLPIFVNVSAIESAQPPFSLRETFPQFEQIVLVVSRLEPERNSTLALEVFARVHTKLPKTGLVIVGDGSEREALEAKSKELGIAESVLFLGWQDTLTAYYKGADVFLNTANYEGYGMALVESAASGCPIVSTDVGVVGAVLKNEESAHVCPVGDARCLAGAVADLLGDEERRAARARAARAAVRRHAYTSEDEYVDALTTLWKHCGEEKQ